MEKLPKLAVGLLGQTFTGAYLISRCRQLTSREGPSKTRLAFALFVDLALGLIAARLVNQHYSPAHLVALLLDCMDTVVFNLRALITWLMGAPAGLKLNSVLSSALGKFFLYHIHLWVTFLYLTAPVVSEALTNTMSVLSYAGVCLQLSVAQDVFNVVTFHVHCFYAYARRLFLSQGSGLTSLWRLFRGKKYNPLRKRVDTSANTQDQLFVGTVAFTILLFLFPTTAMYFGVFKMLELALVAINFVTCEVVKAITTGPAEWGDKNSMLCS
jgi:phosphatidylinositol glycan class Q protein